MLNYNRFKSTLICIIVFLFVTLSGSFANDTRLGANLAAPRVADFMKTLPLKSSQLYVLNAEDTERIIDLAAEIHINVFELIDCTYRYIKPRNIRISISGPILRKLQSKYDLGGERVLAILSVDKLRYLETGAILVSGQKDLDIYLDSPVETFIEIGTARYSTRFGFGKLSPLLFDDAYGIMVQKLFVKTPLESLELFAPGKGAIHVKAISRPKKWNLDVITKLH